MLTPAVTILALVAGGGVAVVLAGVVAVWWYAPIWRDERARGPESR